MPFDHDIPLPRRQERIDHLHEPGLRFGEKIRLVRRKQDAAAQGDHHAALLLLDGRLLGERLLRRLRPRIRVGGALIGVDTRLMLGAERLLIVGSVAL
jgi:hypothetical protein